jgi:hypothetical protein
MSSGWGQLSSSQWSRIRPSFPNPPLRKLLNQMGWSNAEAYARIGLFFWHTDGPVPNPRTASIEADMRHQNLVYDVPRPASLG